MPAEWSSFGSTNMVGPVNNFFCVLAPAESQSPSAVTLPLTSTITTVAIYPFFNPHSTQFVLMSLSFVFGLFFIKNMWSCCSLLPPSNIYNAVTRQAIVLHHRWEQSIVWGALTGKPPFDTHAIPRTAKGTLPLSSQILLSWKYCCLTLKKTLISQENLKAPFKSPSAVLNKFSIFSSLIAVQSEIQSVS